MLEAYETNWMSTVGKNINEIEIQLAEYIGVKYAVALGKRSFMWDVLCDYVEENVLRKEENRA